jgi:hypothetical protein
LDRQDQVSVRRDIVYGDKAMGDNKTPDLRERVRRFVGLLRPGKDPIGARGRRLLEMDAWVAKGKPLYDEAAMKQRPQGNSQTRLLYTCHAALGPSGI